MPRTLDVSRTEGRRQPALRLVRRVAWVVIPLALVGELGHQLFARFGQELAHHFFHLVFGVGAGLVFAVHVAIDIHRHGWPSFEWRQERRLPGKTPGP